MAVPPCVVSFTLSGDSTRARQMAAYMRYQFSFVGLNAKPRQQQSHALIQASQTWPLTDLMAAITALYARPQREYQYVAIDLATVNARRLTRSQLDDLQPLLTQKSWWDSVDAWRKVYGDYLKFHPAQLETVFARFYGRPNFWERRIAITLQLMAKAATRYDLLERAILFDQTTDEFFIQKAIGWALRQDAKTHPAWVTAFLRHHPLSPLARREAQKYLRKAADTSHR